MSLVTLTDRAEKESSPREHVLMVMTPDEGDLKTMWDPDDEDQVDHASETFNKFRDKGMVAYRVKREGGKGEVMREFDPEAEAMIMAPRISGG